MTLYFQATTQIIIWCLLIIIIDSFVIIIILLLLWLFIHYWWPGFDMCEKIIIDLVAEVDDYNQILKGTHWCHDSVKDGKKIWKYPKIFHRTESCLLIEASLWFSDQFDWCRDSG